MALLWTPKRNKMGGISKRPKRQKGLRPFPLATRRQCVVLFGGPHSEPLLLDEEGRLSWAPHAHTRKPLLNYCYNEAPLCSSGWILFLFIIANDVVTDPLRFGSDSKRTPKVIFSKRIILLLEKVCTSLPVILFVLHYCCARTT